jgi:mono/diheme cytochrome c family protein
MRRALAMACAIAVLAVVAAGLAYREAISHGFSAREKPWAIEEFAARHLRRLAVGTQAKQLVNPLSTSPELLAEAREHFADHCAVCHGEDGAGDTEIARGLYPPVPDLRAAAARELTDGELFSIIRNGVRFTGMPGWGGDDEHHWALVLLIRELPHASPAARAPHHEHDHPHGEED